MNRLFFLLFLITAGLWFYDDSLDGGRIENLEKQLAVAEENVKALEGKLVSIKAEHATALSEVEAANEAINTILDKAGRDIDEGLKGIQRLRAINQSYDAAVVAVRDKCGSAVRGAGAGNI